MKFSYKWLNSYFDKEFESPQELSDMLTVHSFECDSVEACGTDFLLDFDILPNRCGDCLGHYGIAREISCLKSIEMKNTIEFKKSLETLNKEDFDLSIDSEENCPRYAVCLIKNIQVKESPKWLKDALESIGQKSINNIVDASNYVLNELGYPTHCFDYDKLEGDKKGLRVRLAKDGEEIFTLEDKGVKLSKNNLVIADLVSDKAIGIAGVKGGMHSGVEEGTKNIVLESALFKSKSIRDTGRELNIDSQAVKNFSKNLTSKMIPTTLHRLINLIVELSQGEVVHISEYYNEKKQEKIELSLEYVKKLLGVEISKNECEDYFNRLNFDFESNKDGWIIESPVFRSDIEIKEDCVEEIARLKGIGNITAQLPDNKTPVFVNKKFYYTNKILEVTKDLGFFEIISYTLKDKGDIKLKKSLAKDKEYLRVNLKDNMALSLKKNKLNSDLVQLDDVMLVEIGNVFEKGVERTNICFGFSKKKCKEEFDLLKTKLSEIGILLEGELIDGIFETSLDSLIENASEKDSYDFKFAPLENLYVPFSQYPFITRDISMFVNDESVEDIMKILSAVSGPLCLNIKLFDEYESDGKRSLAFRLVFQSNEKTLTDKEVNDIMEKVNVEVKSRSWILR